MNDPVLVRQRIRKILSALPVHRPWAREEFVLEVLNEFFAEKVTIDELRTALEWNQSKGYIDYRQNGDKDRIEWFLTDLGRHKEGL